jgi:diguanylate cyclase (GGDEF)-like protein
MAHDVLFSMPILVIDDEPTNTKLLEKILAKAGYRYVISSNDPRDTLSLFNTHHPGLILLDLNMPYLDGFAVLEQLHEQLDTMPPVVVLTAQSDRKSRLQALQGGARDFITKPFDSMELLLRIENMLSLTLAEQERLRFYADFDLLTGLPNRHHTLRRIDDLLTTQEQSSQPVAILLITLQQFKRINQSFGHKVGDQLLCLQTSRLKTLLTATQSILGRVEGARFLIACSGLTSQDPKLTELVQYLIDGLQKPTVLNDIDIRPLIRIGIAVYPEDAKNTVDLLARAEIALANAAESTDVSYAFCDPDTNERVREQLELESELHRALEREEFFLVYQPQIKLETGEIQGVEALLRWQHPVRGIVSPAQFIPILEETGLIVPVGTWLLNAALQQLQQWQHCGLQLRMAINLSPRQFKSNDLLHQIRMAIEKITVPPGCVELEVTESLLVEDFPGTHQLLRTLDEELHIRIALDDFGTGYSALTYLHAFPFHALKIDRSFIAEIGCSQRSEALLCGIVQLAKSLNLEVVAEGIETYEQQQYLIQLGCDIGQGFGFARPQRPEELIDLLHAGYVQITP